jgi:metal-sulfur cluster biosynthetic enzyme
MSQATRREERLWAALKEVEDPELAISVVDMGLIVDLHAVGARVDIKITFTAMGCPAMDMIIDDVRSRLLAEHDVSEVDVEVVWSPVWTKSRLTPEGKDRLMAWGISV